MSKIIYTTDEHATDRKFPCRTDNFLDSFAKKLKVIDEYIAEHKIVHWLSGGDFFDSPHQSTKLINWMIEQFKSFKSQDIFPIHIIAGNHIERKNPDKYIKESGLRTLEEAGYFKI